MKFRLFLLVLISTLLYSEILAVGGIRVIICVDRASLTKSKINKAQSTNHYCYPGAAAVTLPDECNSGTVVVGIDLDLADFFTDDALTLNSLSNVIFADGTEAILDTLDTSGSFRPALITDEDGHIDIEFTRDPTQPSVIELRNVNGGSGQTITIPACTGTVFNGDAAPIPTIGQWGIMTLGLILLIFGANSVLKRRLVQLG